jgi:hypothetical protein
LLSMSKRLPITSHSAKRLADRERGVGLEPDDDAARWLAANDAPPPPATPKAASKNKTLHQWRRRQQP